MKTKRLCLFFPFLLLLGCEEAIEINTRNATGIKYYKYIVPTFFVSPLSSLMRKDNIGTTLYDEINESDTQKQEMFFKAEFDTKNRIIKMEQHIKHKKGSCIGVEKKYFYIEDKKIPNNIEQKTYKECFLLSR